jgi:hypothetical protein
MWTSRPGDWLSSLGFFMIFLSPSRQISGQYLKSVPGHFLPHSFHLMNHYVTRCLYFPPKEDMLQTFITLKNPSPRAGFKLANLGSKGKHDNHYTTKNDKYTIKVIYFLLFLQLNGACWQVMVPFWNQQISHPEGSWNMSWTPKNCNVLQFK